MGDLHSPEELERALRLGLHGTCTPSDLRAETSCPRWWVCPGTVTPFIMEFSPLLSLAAPLADNSSRLSAPSLSSCPSPVEPGLLHLAETTALQELQCGSSLPAIPGSTDCPHYCPEAATSSCVSTVPNLLQLGLWMGMPIFVWAGRPLESHCSPSPFLSTPAPMTTPAPVQPGFLTLPAARSVTLFHCPLRSGWDAGAPSCWPQMSQTHI